MRWEAKLWPPVHIGHLARSPAGLFFGGLPAGATARLARRAGFRARQQSLFVLALLLLVGPQRAVKHALRQWFLLFFALLLRLFAFPPGVRRGGI